MASSASEKAFADLLKNHVKDGVVDYSAFVDNEGFNNYIKDIENKEITEDLSLEEKLAFYINAYNALAIKGIIDGYSPSSFTSKIRYFYLNKYRIAGKKINLYNFEHKVIRPLGEPRIHFALVCASHSCPKLRSEVYTAEKLDKQLNENAIDFINDQEKNIFDVDKKKAKVSKIFDWFTKDFTKEMSLQSYIAQYIQDEKVKALLLTDSFKVKHKKYDWSLNGSK